MSRPSPPLRWAYRLLGWRLGPEHAEWALADLERPGWLARQGVAVALAAAPLVAVALLAGAAPGRLAVVVGLLLGLAALRREALRGQVRSRQETAPADPRVRRRRNLGGAGTTALAVLASLTVLVLAGR